MSNEKEDDFGTLLELVKADANLINDLTDEQVTELRKRINPYGKTIEGEGTFTCLSITNLSEQYMKRFLMTSLIGFLYRQCDEHGLEDSEPVSPMDDYKTFMEQYTSAVDEGRDAAEWLKTVDDSNTTNEYKATVLQKNRLVERGDGFKRRLIIRNFLDTLFEFNPDKHVRSAYSNNPLDTERKRPQQVAPKTISESTNLEASTNSSELVKHIPPSDTFHRWNYYNDTNYEEIRSATCDLYADKPDLEFAINPYGQFDSQEDADKFIQKHKDEIIADILTLHNSKWNLTGSFKNNRERINFYNDKTNVIEEIFKQMEQDKKLGADLMRKRVKRKKTKNIQEVGPEPAEFKQYRKDNSSAIESMGAEDLSRDIKRDTDPDTVSFANHEECPYDAVQVDVFDIRGGGSTVTKSEFFTQAEDPIKPKT